MTERKPLVRVNGEVRQLPDGDTLVGASADGDIDGGSASTIYAEDDEIDGGGASG